jgi:hypothetical protein
MGGNNSREDFADPQKKEDQQQKKVKNKIESLTDLFFSFSPSISPSDENSGCERKRRNPQQSDQQKISDAFV